MHQHIINRVIFLGVVAIIGIVGMQSYWVATTWDLNDSEFRQKVQLALNSVARQLAAANNSDLPSRNIVRPRSSNYFIVNIESEINALQLEDLIQQELVSLSLDVPFEYGIFDCTSDQMAYGARCEATTEPQPEEAVTNASYLPPDENLLYYFGVKFPERNGYLWEKMQVVFFFTAVLLLTVAFFIFSMIVILRQRRLAGMQKDFIDNMTHEFKTPLSTIRIAAGVFQRDDRITTDSRLSRYATLINEQCQRLNNQVEKVLQISRIEKGNFEVKKERVDMKSLFPPLLSGTTLRAEERGGALHTYLPEGELLVNADPVHLSNILHNLLDNAVKYGGGNPQITLGGRRKGDQLHLYVADEGPGIKKEHQDLLFEKFYRVPTGDVHDVKGFGLGLFYVHQICRAHGWQIRVESKEGEGTTFHLKIPLLAPNKTIAPAAVTE